MKVYELRVGLEIHAELKTQTKIFCSCPSLFGGEPNTRVCPICAGLPGAMPALNAMAVELGVRAGLALGSTVAEISAFDRKNYFYPDLPKGYQITQYARPLCTGGGIDTSFGRVRLQRIHLEEDAGKLVHRGGRTLVDLNRCGVPLIEIVTLPDIVCAEQAVEFLKKLRSMLLFAGVSDCRMQEGSLRCDVNVSLSRAGQTLSRTEIKNLGSFYSVKAAIRSEAQRQEAVLEAGESVPRETLRFDEAKGVTLPMRKKERSEEYMYLPEPDLPPLVLSSEFISKVKKSMPEPPSERQTRLMNEYSLSAEEAALICESRETADWFEAASALTLHTRALTATLLTELFALRTDEIIPLSPSSAAECVNMLAEGRINNISFKRLLKELCREGGEPECTAARLELFMLSDPRELIKLAELAIMENPRAAGDHLKGKKNAIKALMGALMRLSSGRAQPQAAQAALLEALSRMEGRI